VPASISAIQCVVGALRRATTGWRGPSGLTSGFPSLSCLCHLATPYGLLRTHRASSPPRHASYRLPSPHTHPAFLALALAASALLHPSLPLLLAAACLARWRPAPTRPLRQPPSPGTLASLARHAALAAFTAAIAYACLEVAADGRVALAAAGITTAQEFKTGAVSTAVETAAAAAAVSVPRDFVHLAPSHASPGVAAAVARAITPVLPDTLARVLALTWEGPAASVRGAADLLGSLSVAVACAIGIPRAVRSLQPISPQPAAKPATTTSLSPDPAPEAAASRTAETACGSLSKDALIELRTDAGAVVAVGGGGALVDAGDGAVGGAVTAVDAAARTWGEEVGEAPPAAVERRRRKGSTAGRPRLRHLGRSGQHGRLGH